MSRRRGDAGRRKSEVEMVLSKMKYVGKSDSLVKLQGLLRTAMSPSSTFCLHVESVLFLGLSIPGWVGWANCAPSTH